MKIKVTRRLHPVGKQARYRITCDGVKSSGDSFCDAMGIAPAWAYPIFDRLFLDLRDARKWAVHNETMTVTLEFK